VQPDDSLRLGCVRYLNALPLIDSWPDPVRFDHPSTLCRELAAGQLDVALVSSFEYLRNPIYSVVDHVAIFTQRERWRGFCDALAAAGQTADDAIVRFGVHDAAAQDRVLGGHDSERGVGVPQPVAQRRHAPLVVAVELVAVLVEVGDVGEDHRQAQFRVARSRIGTFLERTEVAREGELLLVVDVLVGQDSDGVRVHRCLDGRDLGRRQLPACVDLGEASRREHAAIIERRRRGALLAGTERPIAVRPRCCRRRP